MRRSTLGVVAIALAVVGQSAQAQRGGRKELPEFTKQSLLIVNFTPGRGADMRLARRAADAVRSRLGQLANKREVDVIDGDDIRLRTERAGYSADTTYDLGTVHALGRQLRAAKPRRQCEQWSVARIAGQLVLIRDENLRQPIPDVSAGLDSAAYLFAKHIAATARSSIPNALRNALRDGAATGRSRCARKVWRAIRRGSSPGHAFVWALGRATNAPANEPHRRHGDPRDRSAQPARAGRWRRRARFAAAPSRQGRRHVVQAAALDTSAWTSRSRRLLAAQRRKREARQPFHPFASPTTIPTTSVRVQQKWRVIV
jgi:hypothetical protein